MSFRLQSRRLYIADLTRRQFEMECGRVAMQPLAYRVLSCRLREAIAALPDATLRAGFPELPPHLQPQLDELLATRHFDHHARLPGADAARWRMAADTLLARLR